MNRKPQKITTGREIYAVIINEGESIRFFRELTTLCKLMHLDYQVLRAHLADYPSWTGLQFSVWKGVLEGSEIHKGYF